MSQNAFSKIWTVLIVIVLIAGGFLTWQKLMPSDIVPQNDIVPQEKMQEATVKDANIKEEVKVATTRVSLPSEMEVQLGSTVQIPIRVTTSAQIGIAQFTVQYNSGVLRFDSAVIGSDATGFVVSNINPNLPFPTIASGTDKNVLIQISGGGTQYFTGTSREVAILNFTVVGSGGTVSPLAFDQGVNKTNLATVDLQTIIRGNIAFEDGLIVVVP